MTPSPRQILPARWIAPMDGPVLVNAAILFDDRIQDIGPTSLLRKRYPDASALEPWDGCILPGLVNAHAHLELSHVHRPPAGKPFTDWLLSVAPAAARSLESGQSGVEIGIRQCLQFGVSTIGDITARPADSRQRLSLSPLRVVSFGEVRAMGQRRHLLRPHLENALNRDFAGERLMPAVSPHAPYSVEAEGYKQCLRAAQQHGMPLATHLAESLDEALFLRDHTGAFRQLWQTVGGWDEDIPRFAGGPIRYAHSLGLLDHPTLLAHVNYVADDELDLLAQGRASVVYCPRTHAYFNHAPHRWRDMIAHGINVALGTDSAASSGDLNLLEDARLLHRLAPDVAPDLLWSLITTRAARALRLESNLGSLTPGKYADFTLFSSGSFDNRDPLRSLLQSTVLPDQLWIGGRRAS